MNRIHATLTAAVVGLSLPLAAQTVTTVVNNGPSSELYDMVILGDGYTAAQQAQFNQDVLDVVNYFRNNPQKFPYNAYFNCYNVHSVFRASLESGADQPPNNIFRNTVYDATYWYGGTERCLYIQNTAQAAADAALAPDSDGRVIVIVNDSKYGGCAGTYSVCYNGASMEEVQTHEWGHSFGGLADEYDYGNAGTYAGPEFTEPNVTNSSTGNKWAPWLGFAGPNSTVGAYLGGHYYQTGVWRPEQTCQMQVLSDEFCTICRQAFIVQFNRYCDMTTAESPPGLSSAPQFSIKTFSFVNRLAARPHTIEWRVDGGAFVPGTTTFNWSVGNSALGNHTVQLRLTDTSPQVRQDPSGRLVHLQSWVVNVIAPNTKLDRGFDEILPPEAETVEQGSGSSYPFNSSGTRAMMTYGASMIGSEMPVHILGIAFRPEGGTAAFGPTTYDLRVDVSTGVNPTNALSYTFDANHGADRSTVFDGALSVGAATLGTSPSSFVLVIPFDEPFAWNPKCGPLVVDVRNRGLVSGSGVVCDGPSGTVGEYGRIVATAGANSATANFPGAGSTQHFAFVAKLMLDCDAAPSSLALTEGNAVTGYPWGGFANLRIQDAYEGSTFAFTGRQKITRLAWRTEGGNPFGGADYDVRITLSTAAAGITSAMSSTFAANTGADATVVFDGSFTQPPIPGSPAPSKFLLQVELQRPFEYDPSAGALLVDLQLRSMRLTQLPGSYFDATTDPAFGVSRLLGGGWNATVGGSPVHAAYVIAVSGVPSPVLPQSSDHAEGGSSSSFPWNISGPMRAMYGYAGSQLGVTEPVEITHLSWRPDGSATTFGPVTFQVRIDLSTGTLPFVTTFATNHGADLTTVFNGQFSVPYYAGKTTDPEDFAIQVKLDRPFRWDPARGPLVVDIRKAANVAGTMGSLIDGSTGALTTLARVVHQTDANATVADFGPQAFAYVLRLGGEGANALVTPYGAGCNGTNGVPVNSSIGRPWLGNRDFAYALFDARPNTPTILLWGLNQANTSLAVIGAPSCFLLHDAVLGSIGATTDASGKAAALSAVPNTPSFAGITLRSQWLVVDPAGQGTPVPIAMTPGLTITLR
ncbi:MAG: M64 family metallopeptidase [Planctomycetota bacterium]